ncbi:COMM domain-containing protein 3 [Denticeps clupeoides]|uniref:COMM domain-containing protein 3 n=1 Tax=Denticeps clupeoides TaxID=299321 RepID=A0AAY3ZYX5_9TELE|nr:COMM domain-containing protein 3 [Denticeps clupeoides]
MELSESVQKGLRRLADPAAFDAARFAALVEAAFAGVTRPGSEALLDHPELKHADQALVKLCHAAAATVILEAAKQNADRSTISSCLEEFKFDAGRTDLFCDSYQKHKKAVENLLAGIGGSPPHITDVSWRLEYCIKNGYVHKVNQPSYLISFNVQSGVSGGSPSEVNFNCTTEQLQDLVGKMKDAAKSLEKAAQS